MNHFCLENNKCLSIIALFFIRIPTTSSVMALTMQKSYGYLFKGTWMSHRKLTAVDLFGVVTLRAFDPNYLCSHYSNITTRNKS